MFGASQAAGERAPASGYGADYPTQQYGSAGQSGTPGFGAAPGQAPYGAQQQQQGQQPQPYGGQGSYAPPGQQGYGSPQSQPSYGAQPAYGAAQGYPGQQAPRQGYGPSYPAVPAKKSKTGLFVSLAVVVVLAVVAAVLFFTLSKTVLDPAAVQRDVGAQFQDQEGVGIELTCPNDMEVEVGATYECAGTTEDSEDVTLVIEVSDENGNYTWQEMQ